LISVLIFVSLQTMNHNAPGNLPVVSEAYVMEEEKEISIIYQPGGLALDPGAEVALHPRAQLALHPGAHRLEIVHMLSRHGYVLHGPWINGTAVYRRQPHPNET
jgi:hypothetical protein